MEKAIRVLYDYQTFHTQRFGGISRYFCEIARHVRLMLRNSATSTARHRCRP